MKDKKTLPIPEEYDRFIDISNFNPKVLNLPERKFYKEKMRKGSKNWFEILFITYSSLFVFTLILFWIGVI